jgi:hypothetical protein
MHAYMRIIIHCCDTRIHWLFLSSACEADVEVSLRFLEDGESKRYKRSHAHCSKTTREVYKSAHNSVWSE